MAKTVLAVAAALLLLWTGWRVVVLSAEVDRLSRRPDPAPAAVPDPVAPPAPALREEAPRLIAPMGGDAGLARRLASLETKVDALTSRVAATDSVQSEWKTVTSELLAARARANEAAAMATSRNAVSAQAQIQASARCDVDSDGVGEYGGFVEMSGAAAGRMAAPLNPPVLSGAFRLLTPNGEATRSGYLYRIFLPDARGVGIGEPQSGYDRRLADANLSETTWCMYAWPIEYGKTGTKTYFTNQSGDVLAVEKSTYSGTGNGPTSDAAFRTPGSITGAVAVDVVGADGSVWKQVN